MDTLKKKLIKKYLIFTKTFIFILKFQLEELEKGNAWVQFSNVHPKKDKNYSSNK